MLLMVICIFVLAMHCTTTRWTTVGHALGGSQEKSFHCDTTPFSFAVILPWSPFVCLVWHQIDLFLFLFLFWLGLRSMLEMGYYISIPWDLAVKTYALYHHIYLSSRFLPILFSFVISRILIFMLVWF
jgi:hypothetical protein